MIYDSLANLRAYMGMNPGLDKALEYLRTTSLQTLTQTRVEMGGGNYLMVQTPCLKEREMTAFEAHGRYADIQIGLKAGEVVEYLPLKQVKDWSPYDAARDVMLSSDDQAGIPLPLTPGCFAVFFPEDAHRPLCGSGETRKIVVKVLLNQENC